MRSRLGLKVRPGPPAVTIAVIALNVAVFLYGQTSGGYDVFLRWGLWPGFDPAIMTSPAGDQWWRWITSGFVHAGVLHIGINMLMLYTFGRPLEQLLGRLRFSALYLGSLVGGSATIEVLGSFDDGHGGTVHGGASGAIFGLIAAYVIVSLRLRLPVQALMLQAGLWLVLGFFITGISWEGHLGGAVAGAVLSLAILATGAARRGSPPSRR